LNKSIVGIILLSLGVTPLLFSLIATRTDTVIDASFFLSPNEKYEPFSYHTRVITKSTLLGEVSVIGGSVNLTAEGYNTQHLKNVFINQNNNYSLVINSADDRYTFTFENTGDTLSSIKFTLKERWMPFLLPAFVILLILAPIRTVLIIAGLRKKS